MGINDTNLQDSLQEAPPSQLTAQDAEGQPAANGLTAPKTGFDYRALSPAPTPGAPSPGTMAWRLKNALSDPQLAPAIHAGGGLTKLLFTTATDTLLGHPDSLPGSAPPAASAPQPQNSDWTAAQSNSDASRPTSAPIAAPHRGVIDNILAAAGDVAAGAHERSVIGGFAATAAAKTAREREEMQDRVSLAHSNALMLHEQQLVHKSGEDAINASVVTGKQGLDAILNSHVPGQLIAEGKTSDDIKRMIDDKQIDPSTQTVFATGRVFTGRDSNGQPMFRTTYSVVKPGGPVDLKDHEDEVNFIKENAGVDLRAQNGEVTQIPAVQFNQLWQQASNSAITKRAFQVKNAEDQKKIDEAQNSADAKTIFQNHTVLNALNGHTAVTKPGEEDPYAVVKTFDYFMNHPEAVKQTGISNFSAAYIQAAGGKEVFDKKVEEYNKFREKSADSLDDVQKKLSTAHGEEAASIAAGLKTQLDDPKTPIEQKPRLQRMISQASSQAQASQNYDVQKKTREATAESAASAGDMSDLKDMVLHYQYEPDKLFSRFKGLAQKQAFIAEMHRIDPTWSESTYKARYKTAQEFTPEGKGGLAVQSLNTFAGHAGDASDLVNTTGNTNARLLNKPLNKIKSELTANNTLGPYLAALSAAQHEYINFLNNQHAKTQSDEKLAAQLLDENTTPANAQAILRQMAQTIAIRGSSLNHSYRSTMGKDYPDMLSPESAQIMRNFGIDISKIGGISGEAQSAHQQPKQAPPQTHVFDSSAWATANPGKDVNAAIAQAKQLGYEVK